MSFRLSGGSLSRLKIKSGDDRWRKKPVERAFGAVDGTRSAIFLQSMSAVPKGAVEHHRTEDIANGDRNLIHTHQS